MRDLPGKKRTVRPVFWLLCASFLWLAAVVAASANGPSGAGATLKDFDSPRKTPQLNAAPVRAAQAPATTPQGAASAAQDRYIGEAACVDCHDKQRSGYYDSPHHRAADPRTPAAQQSCETCHGPGGKHQDDPVLQPDRYLKN